MSVSIADIKKILINSYSIMYGNIDTKYISMTRFFEKTPGEFDYTCEILIPQIPALTSLISAVETKIAEIQTFNETKDPDASSFVDSQLVQNIAKATKRVLGTSQTSLFDTSATGEAVVASKTFGPPSVTVSKKRKPVINADNIPPTIHAFAVDVETYMYMYRESVSGNTEIFRRKDGSRYEVQTDTQVVTELTPTDPTFVGYERIRINNNEFVVQDRFDSFVRAYISDVSVVNDHETRVSGTIHAGVTNTSTVYAALTTFDEWNEHTLDHLRTQLTTTTSNIAITNQNLGSTVLYDPTNGANVSASALSAWYVHLFADNNPFYAHATLRIERPGFVSKPYIRTVSVNYDVNGVDFSGTVHSPDRPLAEIRVLLVTDALFVGSWGSVVDESFARVYGQSVPVSETVTLVNTRLERLAFNQERRPVNFEDGQTYRLIVWARDSNGQTTTQSESLEITPQIFTYTFQVAVPSARQISSNSKSSADLIYSVRAIKLNGSYAIDWPAFVSVYALSAVRSGSNIQDLTQNNNKCPSWGGSSQRVGRVLFEMVTSAKVNELVIESYTAHTSPGWEIKENGITVVQDIANKGSSTTKFIHPGYTYSIP